MTDLEASRSTHGASERRFLTIEFIDLVGSTHLSEQLDPEDLGPLLRPEMLPLLEEESGRDRCPEKDHDK